MWINEIFDLPFLQEQREIMDVEYEDITPPQEPPEEIIEDFTKEKTRNP